jgi:hypothetical protein
MGEKPFSDISYNEHLHEEKLMGVRQKVRHGLCSSKTHLCDVLQLGPGMEGDEGERKAGCLYLYQHPPSLHDGGRV